MQSVDHQEYRGRPPVLDPDMEAGRSYLQMPDIRPHLRLLNDEMSTVEIWTDLLTMFMHCLSTAHPIELLELLPIFLNQITTGLIESYFNSYINTKVVLGRPSPANMPPHMTKSLPAPIA